MPRYTRKRSQATSENFQESKRPRPPEPPSPPRFIDTVTLLVPFPIDALPIDVIKLALAYIPVRARLLALSVLSKRWNKITKESGVVLGGAHYRCASHSTFYYIYCHGDVTLANLSLGSKRCKLLVDRDCANRHFISINRNHNETHNSLHGYFSVIIVVHILRSPVNGARACIAATLSTSSASPTLHFTRVSSDAIARNILKISSPAISLWSSA